LVIPFKQIGRRLASCRTRLLCLLAICLALDGCYYSQAIRGQYEVWKRSEPISEVIASAGTPAELAERLRLVQDARQFAIGELGLPDNDSYRSYADLGRDYVVWNVFAAPEFSLKPKEWCYPFVGCVAYRGYFKQDQAESTAARLRDKGYDVYVGGVAAYSTLGHFRDPVLNTMLRWTDTQLLAVVFHELAHQLLYIKDDTGFNESFASAVEEASVERFLQSRGQEAEYASYREYKALQQRIGEPMSEAREDLNTYYLESLDEDQKRLLKQHRVEQLAASVEEELRRSGRDGSAWSKETLNNARLLSFSLYEARLPAFRALLADCGEELDCFYREAAKIAALKADQRNDYLDTLARR
jgi:predicted aminopeptidase